MMDNRALVIIDIQNDITKHYRDIIGNINAAIEWAVAEGMHIAYIKHNNTITSTRTFKPGSYDLKKLPEMLAYYGNKGCEVKTLAEYKETR
ncbi:MAG: isochorismatase family protein [Prevotella sp.]|nr:isochorismatase family protein [Prevotella sp.]